MPIIQMMIIKQNNNSMINGISYNKDNKLTYDICIGKESFNTPITNESLMEDLIEDISSFLRGKCKDGFKGNLNVQLTDEDPPLGLLIDVYNKFDVEPIAMGQFWFDDYM